MISIVVFKWHTPGYRSKFTAEHVNTSKRMVDRHYPDPHRFICITDDPAGIDPGIEVVPLWETYGDLKNPTWPDVGPSCYRRLVVFSDQFREVAGDRFVCMDLDAVIVNDMRPVWNRTEDFIIHASWSTNYRYNGSMFMMTAGSRRQVFDDFDPVESPKLAHAAGMTGSDQAWIQYRLGPNEARWTKDHGVHSYHRDCVKNCRGGLPKNSRIVLFFGPIDPWHPQALKQSPWIAKHYR